MNDIEFKVNKYILLRLEGKYTVIYVNGKRFIYCKRLILNIPSKEVDYLDEISSIDEVSYLSDHYLVDNEMYKEENKKLHFSPYSFNIPPETEFWGHCSNIQAWIEYDYDTNILHSNIAFPLLKELTRVGDPKAKRVFKEEIAKRFCSGFYPTIKYLILEGYLFFLTVDELLSVFDICQEKLGYPLYIEIFYEVMDKWDDYMISLEDINKRIIKREDLIKFFSGQLTGLRMSKFFEYFINEIYDKLNYDLLDILHNYRRACMQLCCDYSEAGLYDKLIQHCTFLLTQDTKSSYIWKYLGVAYHKKGLFIYAKAAVNIYQIKEELKRKKISKLHRKIKVRSFFWRHLFCYFSLRYWRLRIYDKRSIRDAQY
ncbi:MAG: hypothetical protein ACXACO_05800 [Promethearchaeota archaeon]